MKFLLYPFSIILIFVSLLSFDVSSEAKAEKQQKESLLIVTAELEDKSVLELPSSITLIDESIIQKRNAQQLTDLLNLAPNVNFATGASRGRFIQIRGIGERSEFVEPVNYSVGIVLDGIDLTGISNAATTLDLQQVEILRGPQGTLYGANGLAGLINLVSNKPTDEFYTKISASVESFSGQNLSAVVSDTVNDSFSYRLAVKKFTSDGFINNQYLNRQDTNNLDELSVRGKLVYQPSDDLMLTTNLFFADIDNGYDAFSLDSNRSTLSDEPGHDKQKTNALSINMDWEINQQYRLETVISHANSELEYGYDEDWSNPTICDSTACDFSIFGYDWWYSSFDNYARNNDNTSLDIKLHSSDQNQDFNWVAGFYLRDQQISLNRSYTYADNFNSQFDTTNIAFYGQINHSFSSKLNLSTGLRIEQRDADYFDNSDAQFNPSENLWGGRLSLEYQYHNNTMIYGLISRGYKAGGVNTSADIPEINRIFKTETMWNYEAGIKGTWLEDTLVFQASIFYQDRKDIQTKESLVRSIESGLMIQQGGLAPYSFTDLTGNAASGVSYGIEIETRWQAQEDLQFYLNLGVLETNYTEFVSYNHVKADLNAIPPTPVDLSGRSLAHAPRYQTSLGTDYFISNQWSINLEVESKNDFYFSDRHDQQSKAYQLINLRLIYQQDDWRLQFYANNITDREVQTRAFGSFGNDPRNFYTTEPYYQLGSPRVIGVSLTTEFY